MDKEFEVDPAPPTSIGPYLVLRQLGDGGMGRVYLAKRADDQMGTEVAVKVLKHGAASAQAIRRFQLERQILADLEHPNIARLKEGGDVDGLPFYAMEYVRGGLPITHWCRRNSLDLEARLRLFETVARTVHFAHRNQVIHRDLKPANILVDQNGLPKLLDFGIARLVKAEGETRTLTSQQALTPDYASPEQLAGLPVTTSSDIYALGLLLFEMLTDSRPFNHSVDRDALLAAMSGSLPRPSMRLRRPGGKRGRVYTFPRGWEKTSRRLKGDLDNIVLTALRREPERRYDSAMEMAQDVARYLNGFPVQARSESLAYVSLRFMGRHKPAVLALVALVLGMLALGAYRLERREAQRAGRNAEALSKFTTGVMGVFDPYDPDTLHSDPSRMLLELRKQLGAFEGDPLTHATLLHGMGRALIGQGQLGDAEEVLLDALRLVERYQDPLSLSVADILEQLGHVNYFRSRLSVSKNYYHRVLAIRGRHLPEDHVLQGLAHMNLGRFLVADFNYELGEAHLEKAQRILKAHQDEYLAEYCETIKVLGMRYFFNQPDRARPLLQECLAIAAQFGEHPLHAEALLYLGRFYLLNGDREKGSVLMKQSIEMVDRVLQRDHYTYLALLSLLAEQQRRSEPEQALEKYQRLLEIMGKSEMGESPEDIFVLCGMVELYLNDLRFEKAREVHGVVLRILKSCEKRPELFSEHQITYARFLVHRVGAVLCRLDGKLEEQLALLEQSYQAYMSLEIRQVPVMAQLLMDMTRLKVMMGETDAAARNLQTYEAMANPNKFYNRSGYLMTEFYFGGIRAELAFSESGSVELECDFRETLLWLENRGVNILAQARTACMLAALLQRLGRLDEAEGLLVLVEDLLWQQGPPSNYRALFEYLEIFGFLNTVRGLETPWPMVF